MFIGFEEHLWLLFVGVFALNEGCGTKLFLGCGCSPPSPDYVSDPEEPKQASLSLDYVPKPEYPEYLAPFNAKETIEDQPFLDDASPTTLSPGYVADSSSEEDHKEDPTDYLTNGEDDVDDESSNDDDDDDEQEASEDDDEEEEEEEHPSLVDSYVIPVDDLVLSAKDTKSILDVTTMDATLGRLMSREVGYKIEDVGVTWLGTMEARDPACTDDLDNAGPGGNKPYEGSKPLCPKCNYHHDGQCVPKCANYKRTSHLIRDYRSYPERVLTFFGNGNVVARAYNMGIAGTNPNFSVVTSTLLLNNHYASILVDTGVDRIFVSTASISLIDIIPTILDQGYDVKLAGGRIIWVNTL
nr:hypothetical protein [Tanacetum cinerariifolium]